jgi:hypothetical protein
MTGLRARAVKTTEIITAIPYDNWDPQIENICKEIEQHMRKAIEAAAQVAAQWHETYPYECHCSNGVMKGAIQVDGVPIAQRIRRTLLRG